MNSADIQRVRRVERRDGLEVVVFSEEQIVPWVLGDDEEE